MKIMGADDKARSGCLWAATVLELLTDESQRESTD